MGAGHCGRRDQRRPRGARALGRGTSHRRPLAAGEGRAQHRAGRPLDGGDRGGQDAHRRGGRGGRAARRRASRWPTRSASTAAILTLGGDRDARAVARTRRRAAGRRGARGAPVVAPCDGGRLRPPQARARHGGMSSTRGCATSRWPAATSGWRRGRRAGQGRWRSTRASGRSRRSGCETADELGEGTVLTGLGALRLGARLAACRGDAERCRALSERCLARARAAGEPLHELYALAVLGVARAVPGRRRGGRRDAGAVPGDRATSTACALRARCASPWTRPRHWPAPVASRRPPAATEWFADLASVSGAEWGRPLVGSLPRADRRRPRRPRRGRAPAGPGAGGRRGAPAPARAGAHRALPRPRAAAGQAPGARPARRWAGRSRRSTRSEARCGRGRRATTWPASAVARAPAG